MIYSIMEENNNQEIFKPSLLNAFLPEYVEKLFISFLIFCGIFVIFYIINLFFLIVEVGILLIVSIIFLNLIFAFIISIKKFIKIYNTQYILHKHRIEQKYQFFKIETNFVPYDQIVDIKVNMTIWDRVCRVSDMKLILRFNNNLGKEGDKYGMLIKDVKKPEELKKKIIDKMNSSKNSLF